MPSEARDTARQLWLMAHFRDHLAPQLGIVRHAA